MPKVNKESGRSFKRKQTPVRCTECLRNQVIGDAIEGTKLCRAHTKLVQSTSSTSRINQVADDIIDRVHQVADDMTDRESQLCEDELADDVMQSEVHHVSTTTHQATTVHQAESDTRLSGQQSNVDTRLSGHMPENNARISGHIQDDNIRLSGHAHENNPRLSGHLITDLGPSEANTPRYVHTEIPNIIAGGIQDTLIDSSQTQIDSPTPQTPGKKRKRTMTNKCRKWMVTTQGPVGYCGKICSCYACTQAFTIGEPRLQQWGDRNTCSRYVHPHCVNGGLNLQREFLPKTIEDNIAIANIKADIAKIETDINNLLPVAEESESAAKYDVLTQDIDIDTQLAEQEDETAKFNISQEHQFKRGEQQLDLSWFSNIDWQTILLCKGTTYVQVPHRHEFAFQQAQQAILQSIVENETASVECANSWKLLVLSSWFLLSRVDGQSSDKSCATHLDERLQLFWAEAWQELWNQIKMDTDPPIPKKRPKPTQQQQLQARARRASTLARAGEKGRALAAVRQQPAEQFTPQIF